MTSTTSKTTVSRDGVVTSDGAIIGHVKKEMRQGMFATLADRQRWEVTA